MSKDEKKKQKEKLLESIAKVETNITLHTAEGNKVAVEADKRTLEALKNMLKSLKSQ